MTELEKQLKQDAIDFINSIDKDSFPPITDPLIRYAMMLIKTHQSYAILKYDKDKEVFCSLRYEYLNKKSGATQTIDIPLNIKLDLSKNYPHSENISNLLNK